VQFFKPNYNWAIEVPFNDYQIIEAKVLDSEGTFKVEAFNEKVRLYLTFILKRVLQQLAPGKLEITMKTFSNKWG